MEFKVYSLDVWGNDKDGYTVNDCYDTGITLNFDDISEWGDFDREVVKHLKRAGMVKKRSRYNRFDIDGDIDYTIYVNDAKNYEPLYDLRRIQE